MSTEIEPTVIDLEQPATAENVAPEVKTEEVKTDEGTQPEEKLADKTFTQAELDEIVQKRINKLERKMEKQRIESETRAKVMQEVASKPEPAADKPKVEDYTDYADFIEDLTDWKTDQKIKASRDSEVQEKAKQSQQSEQDRRTERQHELLEMGERKYDDFEEVVKSDKVNYSQAAYLSILESDISADIVYHLAKHQEEAKRIADLPAYAQAKEIGKLEDRLLAKQPVKASNAPKPIEPIGSGTASTKSLSDMPPEEYIKHRLKQKPKWA